MGLKNKVETHTTLDGDSAAPAAPTATAVARQPLPTNQKLAAELAAELTVVAGRVRCDNFWLC